MVNNKVVIEIYFPKRQEILVTPINIKVGLIREVPLRLQEEEAEVPLQRQDLTMVLRLETEITMVTMIFQIPLKAMTME